jgi:FkbM family methyltransferase
MSHLVIATLGSSLSALTAIAREKLLLKCLNEKKHGITFITESGMGRDRARNMAVGRFLQEMPPSEATHLMFLDHDLSFRAEDIIEMLESGHDVVGIAYPKKGIHWQGVVDAVRAGVDVKHLAEHAGSFVYNGDIEGRLAVSGTYPHRYAEVAQIGTGALMMSRQCLTRYIDHYKKRIEYKTNYMHHMDIADNGRSSQETVHHLVFVGMNDPRHEREMAMEELLFAAREGYSLVEAAARYRQACDSPELPVYLTEDYSFCSRWRLMDPANKVMMFVDACIMHHGEFVFTGHLGHAVSAMRPALALKSCPADVEAGAREVLDGLYDAPGVSFETPPVVLDIGANVGAYAVWAAARWPGAKIHCYEPIEANLEHLRANVGDGVEVHPVAVLQSGARPALMRPGRSNAGEWSVHGTSDTDPNGKTVLAAAVGVRELPRADVLKIDTEGCEWEILGGYDTRGVRVVALEWHSLDDKVALSKLLTANAFQCVTDKTWRADRGEMVWTRSVEGVAHAT